MKWCHADETKQNLLTNKISVHFIGLVDHIKLLFVSPCVRMNRKVTKFIEIHRIHSFIEFMCRQSKNLKGHVILFDYSRSNSSSSITPWLLEIPNYDYPTTQSNFDWLFITQ